MHIYKYKIPMFYMVENAEPSSPDVRIIEMPKGAVPLSVGYQRGQGFMVWAAVNRNRELVQHRFYMLATGYDEIPPPGRLLSRDPYPKGSFVGKIQADDGTVWHVFDGGDSIPPDERL